MNLIGRIFTVLILVMSILFMGFAMMVYATHRNWRDLSQERAQQVTRLRSDNAQLESDNEELKNQYSHERAARTAALASLESQKQEALQEVEMRNQQYTELLARERELTEAVATSQRQLEQLNTQVSELQQEVRSARQDRDQQFARVQELTDKLHQAEGTRQRLSEQLQQLTEDFTAATTVLRANDLSIDTPVSRIPPDVHGEVVALDNDMLELSVGEDDGFKRGHVMLVSRSGKYLARAVVERVAPDRAIARIQYRNAPIQEGDRVQTKVEIR